MNKLVITEVNLAARLSRSTLLKYLDNTELKFIITDICYHHRSLALNNDKAIANKLIEEGMLEVPSLDESQMERLETHFNHYKPKFIPKTISALILAKDMNLKLISEDELLRQTAISDFGIQAFDKEWLVGTIIREIIYNKGVNLDWDLVKMIT